MHWKTNKQTNHLSCFIKIFPQPWWSWAKPDMSPRHASINSSIPKTVRQALLLVSFYREGNGGIKRLGNLPIVSWLRTKWTWDSKPGSLPPEPSLLPLCNSLGRWQFFPFLKWKTEWFKLRGGDYDVCCFCNSLENLDTSTFLLPCK